jgi:hypothetical protein
MENASALSRAIAAADTRTDFEFAELPIALAERSARIENFRQANEAHRLINSSREIAIEIGRFLTERREDLPPGELLSRVHAKCNFSVAHFYRYLKIFQYRDAMPPQENFSFRAADALIRVIENKSPRTKTERTCELDLEKLIKRYGVDAIRDALDKIEFSRRENSEAFALAA